MNLRLLHRQLSPWMLPLVLFAAASGLIYRLGRAWFGLTKPTGGKILHLHAGEWLGADGSVLFTLISGATLLFLVGTGLWMWFRGRKPKAFVRKLHWMVAIVVALPLMLSAVTGMAYQVADKWLHAGKANLKLLMSLHQGSWLGPDLRAYYILIVGIGAIVLCITGFRMRFPRKPAPRPRAPEEVGVLEGKLP